ncbi:MAG: sigma-70 family RNA polymerase sigma factor [Lachnospiraceae bacterium]|nr:sigma-70 family RNA polymerase sigma factor [Lachnospiraceae bacterium]MBQ6196935.1 sigma-70 family RNA polymerase sigma factor [Lachnospiraceae bacterium]
MQSKLEQLYELYRGRLIIYASRFLPSEADAEDVVQDAFLYVSEKPGKIKTVDSAETYHYLSVIVKHKALDRLREMRSFVQDPFPLEDEQASCEIPEETPLSAALRQMPERARDMLLMRYADGISTREIARLYGMKPDSVRRALHRAKSDLKKRLTE